MTLPKSFENFYDNDVMLDMSYPHFYEEYAKKAISNAEAQGYITDIAKTDPNWRGKVKINYTYPEHIWPYPEPEDPVNKESWTIEVNCLEYRFTASSFIKQENVNQVDNNPCGKASRNEEYELDSDEAFIQNCWGLCNTMFDMQDNIGESWTKFEDDKEFDENEWSFLGEYMCLDDPLYENALCVAHDHIDEGQTTCPFFDDRIDNWNDGYTASCTKKCADEVWGSNPYAIFPLSVQYNYLSGPRDTDQGDLSCIWRLYEQVWNDDVECYDTATECYNWHGCATGNSSGLESRKECAYTCQTPEEWADDPFLGYNIDSYLVCNPDYKVRPQPYEPPLITVKPTTTTTTTVAPTETTAPETTTTVAPSETTTSEPEPEDDDNTVAIATGVTAAAAGVAAIAFGGFQFIKKPKLPSIIEVTPTDWDMQLDDIGHEREQMIKPSHKDYV